MSQVFSRIYEHNEWGRGSGEGSFPEHNQRYARFLERFIRERRVRQVLDVGCGDWQFSRFVDWGGADYLGLDVVPSVIEANTRQFARSRDDAQGGDDASGRGAIEFRVYSGDPDVLPPADLLICKDVLQHLPDADVQRFVARLRDPQRGYPLALLTNCVNPKRRVTVNKDIAVGEFRYLDLRRPPFDLRARSLFTFTNFRPGVFGALSKPRWRKRVLLWER